MAQVARQVSGEEALAGYVKLARASRLTAEEHDQFALWAQVLKAELDDGKQARQELEKLKEEHGKCPKQPNGTPVDTGQVGSQADGTHMGESRSLVALDGEASELIQ